MTLDELAEAVARSYATSAGVVATVVAGSVGRGRADAFSDVEVDVYWSSAPSERGRLAAVEGSGGQVVRLWDYDAEDEEWSDDLSIDGVPASVSSFTCATVEDILDRQDGFRLTDQLRLSSLCAGSVVTGAPLVDRWRARVAYSDTLRAATLEHYLGRVPVSRWARARTYAAREDWLALRQICDRTLAATLGMWFALNRAHVEHPLFKWARASTQTFDVLPVDAQDRLDRACVAPPARAADLARWLLVETVGLVEAEVPGVGSAAQVRAALADAP